MASPVCGRGVVGVDPDPVCIGGRTRIKPDCFKMKQLGQESARKAKNDGIKRQDHNERKNHFRKREGPHLDWQSAVISSREPA